MWVESPELAAAQLPQTAPECHAVIAQLPAKVKLLDERISPNFNNSPRLPPSNDPGGMDRAQYWASQRTRGA